MLSILSARPHWLLSTQFGRALLLWHLRHLAPHFASEPGPSTDEQLEDVIDTLGIRSWPRPTSVRQHLQYLAGLLRLLRKPLIVGPVRLQLTRTGTFATGPQMWSTSVASSRGARYIRSVPLDRAGKKARRLH